MNRLHITPEHILHSLEALTDEQLEATLATTARGFGIWAGTAPSEHEAALLKAAAVMRARIDQSVHTELG